MSRIIVKNLPSGCKEEKVRNLFGEKGVITDCTLKYSKDGVFRKFAFVGYKTEKEAQEAVKHFNKSYMNTSKLQVELAKNFGDATKPRAWSKYSRDSSAYQKMLEKLKEKEEVAKKNKNSDEKSAKISKDEVREGKVNDLLGELKDDPKFQEFLEAHTNRTMKATWTNDVISAPKPGQKGSKVNKNEVALDEDSDEDEDEEDTAKVEESDDDENDDENDENDSEEDMDSAAVEDAPEKKNDGLSDMDYLKSKMKKKTKLFDSDSEDSSESEESPKKKGNKTEKKKKKKQKTSESEGSDSDEAVNVSTKDKKSKKKKNKKKKKLEETLSENSDSDMSEDETREQFISAPQSTSEIITHVIKMKGLPPNVRENQIKEFFRPQKAVLIKIPKNAKGKQSFSIATVEFATNEETDQAMGHNKNFIGPKKIYLYKVKKDHKETAAPKPCLWEIKLQEKKASGEVEEEETIAESGRLYVRNLPYVCTEEDLEKEFGKYGPLTEVHLPVDMYTKKVKGFAFITYMIPEHAVKAYADMDGTVFQGRMLHILPGKMKKEEEITDDMSYKKKQELKKKAAASSSHNWNTLFLGANAVADVMAEKYGTTKSDILDATGRQSLGVRMALGETQIVSETRDFLMENGVALDSFSQAAGARSKTVILVKNLPAGTKADELRDIFSKHGTLGRVVLPPSGITAVVEYLEPSEARGGFRRLAYSKFQHVPLYLEWAPMNVFTNKPEEKPEETEEKTEKEETMEVEKQKQEEPEESSSEEEDVIEPESTLFVKNLNFETTEEGLKEKFAKCGEIRNVTIAKKKDVKNPGQLLSLGYGFVEFKRRASAQKALKKLQHCELDEHQLELKTSNRATLQKDTVSTKKKQDATKKQKSTKILVRNVPFEAKVREVRELFSVFGELKTVRLPKKLSGTGSHRGFGFIDFVTKQDAKRAFNALCHSTHLYGRRLVLEWAESEETVEQLRKKTAEHFHDGGPSKKLRKASLMDELKLGGGKSTDAE